MYQQSVVCGAEDMAQAVKQFHVMLKSWVQFPEQRKAREYYSTSK
jgi:hypothetical protein